MFVWHENGINTTGGKMSTKGSSILSVSLRLLAIAVLQFFIVLLPTNLRGQTYASAFDPLSIGKLPRTSFKNNFVDVEHATGFVGLTVPIGPGIGARGLHYTPTVRMRISPKNNPHPLIEVEGSGQTYLGTVYSGNDASIILHGKVRPPFGEYLPGSLFFINLENLGSQVPGAGDIPSSNSWLSLWEGAFYGQDAKFSIYAFDTDESSLRSLDPGYAEAGLDLGSFQGVLPTGETISSTQAHPSSADAETNQARAIAYSSLLQDFGYSPTHISSAGAFWGTSGHLIFALKDESGSDASYTDGCFKCSRSVGGWNHTATARYIVIKGEISTEFAFVGKQEIPMYEPITEFDMAPNPAAPKGKVIGSEASNHLYVVSKIKNRHQDFIQFNHNEDKIGFSAELFIDGNPTGEKLSFNYINNDNGYVLEALNAGVYKNARLGPLGNINFKLKYEGSRVIEYRLRANDEFFGESNPYGVIGDSRNITILDDHHGWAKRRILAFLDITEPESGFNISIKYKTIEFSTNSYPTSGYLNPYSPYETLQNVAIQPIRTKVFDSISFSNGEELSFQYGDPYYYYSAFHTDWWNEPFVQHILGAHRFPPLAWGVREIVSKDVKTGASRTTKYYREYPECLPGKNLTSQWRHLRFWEAEEHPDGQVELRKFIPPIQGSTGANTEPVSNWMQLFLFSKNTQYETRLYSPGSDWRSEIETNSTMATSLNYAAKWGLHGLGNPEGKLQPGAIATPTQTVSWNRFVTTATQKQFADFDSASQMWKDSISSFFNTANPYTTFDLSPVSLGSPQGYTQPSSLPGFVVDRKTSTTYLPLDTHYFPGLWTRREHFQGIDKRLPDEVQEVTSPKGIVTSYQSGNPSDQLWKRIEFIFGEHSGLPSSLTVKASPGHRLNSGEVGIEKYGYDTLLRLNYIKPKGVSWSLKQGIDPLFGLPLSQTDANDQVTSYQWDPVGRLTEITPPSPELGTSISYIDFRTLKITRGGKVSTEKFNAFGELTSLENGTGGVKTFTYDLGGRKTFESVWGSTTVGTSFEYQDPLFRLTKMVTPNGEVTRNAYTGLWRSVTAAPGTPIESTIHFGQDSLGRLIKVVDAAGHVTDYTFDSADRIKGVTQWAGASGNGMSATGTGVSQVRVWGYDDLGRLIQVNQPESGITLYGDFDVTGKPWLTTYNGREVASVFSSIGQVTSVFAVDGSVALGFKYDEPGRGRSLGGKLTTANAPGVTRSLTYGGLNGRLSEITYTIGNAPPFTLGHTYTSSGNVASRTYPNGQVQTIPYDDSKEMPNGTFFNGVNLATISNDPTHWGLNAISYVNGAMSIFGYDPDQARLRKMTHLQGLTTIKDWTYAYDQKGRLENDSEDWYRYSVLDQLTSAKTRDFNPLTGGTNGSGNAIWQRIGYDTFGNRTSLDSKAVMNWPFGALPPSEESLSTTVTSKAKTYSFNSLDAALSQRNQLPAVTGSNVPTGAHYDPQGNLTRIYGDLGDSSKQISMVYNALGRVTRMSDSARNIIEAYSYDDQGLRVLVEVYQGTVRPENLQKKQYRIYNESRQLVSEYDLVLE